MSVGRLLDLEAGIKAILSLVNANEITFVDFKNFNGKPKNLNWETLTCSF